MGRGRGICRLLVPDRGIEFEALGDAAVPRRRRRSGRAEQERTTFPAQDAGRWRVTLRPRPAKGAGRGETKVFPLAERMSAFGCKADMTVCAAHVCF